ncbi:MAG: hypothetical protein A2045_05990 [Rhodocyclales bacterium GWA2_65_20]|nr:MAG: hypothetical protein A2045_05990 [Rhodocyclales bacterium GWA2_65_20]
MNDGGFVSRRELVQQLRALCARRLTGMVFLVTEDNRMLQMRLERGEIVQVTHRNRRGLEALMAVSGAGRGRLRFDASSVASTVRDELTTEMAFDALLAETGESRPVEPPAGSFVLPAEMKSTIQSVMVRYVGPMAEYICQEQFERATDVPSLVRSLAAEIPSLDRATKFRAEMAGMLGLA